MSDPWPPRPPEEPDPRHRSPDLAPPPEVGNGGDAPDDGLPGRMSANRRAVVITMLVVIALVAVAALAFGPGGAPRSPTFPPVGSTTSPAGAAAAATRADIVTAFAAQGLQAEDVVSPYRPAEAPRLAAAPRIVVRAVIAADPDHGRVVIYEFLDSAAATVAAQEQASYVASGVGLVQFPPQTQFALRVVGSTVVFYAWSAANAPDPGQAAAVATALATLGFGVPVPN
ncbi:MAG: hypothetical protein V4515_13795 [Chloroflexota bacterium]